MPCPDVLDYVGVLELAGEARFVQEAPELILSDLLVGQEHLDRNGPTELRVQGLNHSAHPAHADLALGDVAPKEDLGSLDEFIPSERLR